MLESKKINIIVAIAVVFALIVSIGLVIAGKSNNENGGTKTEAEYATKIFGTDIISIEIIADEDDWQNMLDNARNEQFIMADVVVNGTKFKNVGIRPKGNSSLTQVVNSNSDRYSFRLQFDEYIKGQTCFGLDSFVVNNMISDSSYMKEYVSYELMKEIGVDAPYFGFADIKVNGKKWGLYLAVETYGDSYEERTFGTTSGIMYNVKSMDMGDKNKDGNGFPQGNGKPPQNGQGPNFPPGGMQPPMNMKGEQTQPNTQDGVIISGATQLDKQKSGKQSDVAQSNKQKDDKQTDTVQPNQRKDSKQTDITQPSQQKDDKKMDRQNGKLGGPMGGRGSNGGSLEYTTDEISSYGAIFNNVVGKASDSDFKRVITALKALSEGKDLEKYFDVDKILRYLAAHTVVVNLDSYSSNMAQNYYLYENNGKVTILPWDYNLAWGGFQSGDASSVINFPIDTPVSGVEMSSRPLLEKLFSNKEYLEKYHGYLQELMTNYFADGKWEKKIAELDALISDYVKNDSTAFCTFEQYKTAVETLKTLGNLRYQSIQGQLDGKIPSTKAEQTANQDKLISAGNLKLSSLGSMMGAGNHGGFAGKPTDKNNQQGDKNFDPNQMQNMPDPEVMMQAMQILQNAGGSITDEVKSKLLQLGLTEEQISMMSQMKDMFQKWPGGNMNNSDKNNIPSPFGGQTINRTNTTKSLLIYSGLFAFVLIATFFIAKKKRNY